MHPEVGQKIDSSAERDAIHVAIAPVVAGESLNPGQSICLQDDGFGHQVAVSANYHNLERIGVVDPFLEKTLKAGDKFYMFLPTQSHLCATTGFTRRSKKIRWARAIQKASPSAG